MRLQHPIMPMHPGDKIALITTLSGLCGGMYKTFSINSLLWNITMDGAFTVIGYAVLSATAGFITQFIFDAIKKHFF